jgi:hypothetical protein
VTEIMTLDALITQLKKLRSADSLHADAQVRVNCTGCSCWHPVEGVRPGMWNGEPTVELVTE